MGKSMERELYEEEIASREKRIAELEFEVVVLRMYGNKDCTAMADEQLAKKRAGLKCDFEDWRHGNDDE